MIRVFILLARHTTRIIQTKKKERVYRQRDLTIVTFSLSFASGSAFSFGSLNKRYVKDKRTKHKNIEIRFKTLFEI